MRVREIEAKFIPWEARVGSKYRKFRKIKGSKNWDSTVCCPLDQEGICEQILSDKIYKLKLPSS